MRVLMMLVVNMAMRMLAARACVLVLVALGQVEPYAGDHDAPASQNAGEALSLSQNNEIAAPMNGAGRRSRGAEAAQCQHKEHQTDAVTEQPQQQRTGHNAQRYGHCAPVAKASAVLVKTSHQPLAAGDEQRIDR